MKNKIYQLRETKQNDCLLCMFNMVTCGMICKKITGSNSPIALQKVPQKVQCTPENTKAGDTVYSRNTTKLNKVKVLFMINEQLMLVKKDLHYITDIDAHYKYI